MRLHITPVRPEDLPELARVCYDAFGTLHDRHNTPRDFDSLDTATMVLRILAQAPSTAGFAARQDGALVGSNFITFADEVAGVGPITVDPRSQARGVGRALMRAVLEEASRRDVRQVRLLQEAINTTSLSLYASLGFTWRDSVAIMQAAGPAAGPGVRPMTEADIDRVGAIAAAQYGAPRVNEVRATLRMGLPAFVRERSGRVSAYLLPGFLGHGFGESVADMAELVAHAASAAPPAFHRVFVPLSQGELFLELLNRGSRTIKVMSYMTVGPYTTPRAAWMPSILN